MYLGRLVELAPVRSCSATRATPTPKPSSPLPSTRTPPSAASASCSGAISPARSTRPLAAPRTRCPYALPACAERVPELRDVGGGHFKACIRDEPSSGRRRPRPEPRPLRRLPLRRAPLEPSLWYATAAPAPDLPALEEDIETDVIVGAGYTGPSTALHLAPKACAPSLEAEEVGWRLRPQRRPLHPDLPLLLDPARAPDAGRALGGAADPAPDRRRQPGRPADRGARHRLRVAADRLHAAYTPSALAGLEEHNRQYVAVGKATRVLDRGDQRLTGSERYFGAWFHPRAATSTRSATPAARPRGTRQGCAGLRALPRHRHRAARHTLGCAPPAAR